MAHTNANGARFHYRLEGLAGAPVVVFSNSLGTNLAMWDAQIPALAQKFRVLRYDSRGHGLSDVTPGPYTIEILGRDVDRLARRAANSDRALLRDLRRRIDRPVVGH